VNFHKLLIVDVLVGFAIMEAIVKPLVVRASKKAMRWMDSHVEWIPDWLYYPLKKED
jgi:hypothetical protein